MSKKDLLTTLSSAGLANPNFSKTGADSQPIEDRDVTDATNDVSDGARITLGLFLSKKTEKNSYPVSGNSELVEVKPRGPGASLSDPSAGDQKAFADQNDLAPLRSSGLGVKNAVTKGATNRQVTFFGADTLGKVLSKDSSIPSLTGDTLLSEIPKEEVSPVGKVGSPQSPSPEGEGRGYEVLKAIHQQLVDGNLYSPAEGKPFFKSGGGLNEEEQTHGLFTVQRDLGTFNIDGQRVKVSDMSKMAISLMLRSVGNSETALSVLSNYSLGDDGLVAVKIFTRPAQIGLKGVSISDYRLNAMGKADAAKDTTLLAAAGATGQSNFGINLQDSTSIRGRGAPNDSSLPQFQSSPLNATSYAQLNSFLEPFSTGTRFSSTGMFSMATASTLVMLGLGLIIDAISGIAGHDGSPASFQNPSSMVLGRHKSEGPFAGLLTKLLQVTRTDYDFGDCVGNGIALIYGLADSSMSTTSQLSNPSSALVIAENLVLAGGFYANFTRRMLASATNIASVFSKVGGNQAASQDLEAFFRGIEQLLDSPVYKFIMVAAGVGDASLKSRYGMVDVSNDQRLIPFGKIESFNPIQNATGSMAQVSIYRNQTNRWSGGKHSLSLHTFFAAQKSPFNGMQIDKTSNNRFFDPDRKNVEDFENGLEAEYMPFYVHDLRTHEVMSFPAFITEFGETFNANYNAVDGIGRQDPVRLYQKTERAVTFGFMLVAFNEADHDHLWMAINKLVAMCYPQYSAGRVRQTADGKTTFIQPFSQVQAASPMVRLRLADVFKSNYSKFGLARLFGAGNSALDDVIKKETGDEARANAQKDVKNAEEKANKSNFDKTKAEDNFAPGQQVILNINGKATEFDGKSLNESKNLTLSAGDVVTVVAKIPSLGYTVNHEKSKKIIFATQRDFKDFAESYKKSIIDSDPDVIAARQKLAATTTKMPDTKFFSSEKDGNAIVRSFESTRGRGVAGFITTLSLDYGMGSYPWSDKIGSKAPMVVKIGLGFTPITDLPLGLDYDGYIRNPSHPVGNLAGGYGDVYYGLSNETGVEELKPMPRSGNVVSVNDTIRAKNNSVDDERKRNEIFTDGTNDILSIF